MFQGPLAGTQALITTRMLGTCPLLSSLPLDSDPLDTQAITRTRIGAQPKSASRNIKSDHQDLQEQPQI